VLSPDQQLLLQTVFDYFNEHGEWPSYGDMTRKLVREMDVPEVARSLPEELINNSMAYQTQHLAELSVLALFLCDGSAEVLDGFVRALRLGLDRFFDSTNPKPEIASHDLRKDLGLPELRAQQVYHLLTREGITAGGGYSPDRTWRYDVNPGVRLYADVATIGDYLRIQAEQREARRPKQNLPPLVDPFATMFRSILLAPEQKELLGQLIEASRSVPRDKRQKFFVTQTVAGDSIVHPGLPNGSIQSYAGDVEALAREGLVALSQSAGSNTSRFDITQRGVEYYGYLRRQAGVPLQRVEQAVRSYLDADYFRRQYPVALQKWSQAEERLWISDYERELTAIGHFCREALQDFAAALVTRFQPVESPSDHTKTVARIRAVLDQQSTRLGKATKELLLASWGATSDLAMRQEHGAQREGEPLRWEDARRVVFQVAAVMVELDHALA